MCEFNFPYPEYDVQRNFMLSLYEVLENKQIGIFESPTGTGKTLSLLCGSLKWLMDNEIKKKESIVTSIRSIESAMEQKNNELSSSKDWIDIQYKLIALQKDLLDARKALESDKYYEEWLSKVKDEQIKVKKQRKFKISYQKILSDNSAPDNSNSDPNQEEGYEFSLNEDLPAEEEDEENVINNVATTPHYSGVKIFYSSRTHSQLNQVSNEIKKTIYAKDIRVVSLASRQNYCINPLVKALNSNDLINEKCTDLQKLKTKTVKVENSRKRSKVAETLSKCSYHNNKFEDLKNEIIVEVIDIEDLVKRGQELKICPYYSSKLAVEHAHVVLLPYQMLLNSKIRQQFSIDLKNNIVIIDEAHNLLDTISDMYSASLNSTQLDACELQLKSYLERYIERMKTKNIIHFNQLIFIVHQFAKLLRKPRNNGNEHRMLTIIDLMGEADIGNMHLRDILLFCEESRLAEKVHGFAKSQNNLKTKETSKETKSATQQLLSCLENTKSNGKTGSKIINSFKTEEEKGDMNDNDSPAIVASVIRPVLKFLECLTDRSDAGRILICNESKSVASKNVIKYILLKPDEQFKTILDDCRSLILAGGTMQPTSEVINILLQGHIQRVKEHFFGHVVSQDACLPLVLKKGPRGVNFRFNFMNRSNPQLLADLGSLLLNVCALVPHGVVCFFPSYDYLSEVYNYFEKTNILKEIEKKKAVFTEPRNRDTVEKVLQKYRNENAHDKPGGILFSVVGGKLSEGLNFSDNLGRCVIVVGMPYPNKTSPELIEKMKYYKANLGDNSGSVYYENLCMKAVNQSIGRSIRHINDYASILLLDERYSWDNVLDKLPKWIISSLRVPVNYGQGQIYLAKFFAQKRKKN